MITLLIMVVLLSVICGLLCKFVSALVGVIFIMAAMAFTLRMAKEILR